MKMQGNESYPTLQALLQENLSGPLPKSVRIALQPSQRSSNSSAASDSDFPVIGGILKDGRYSWLSRGSKLVLVMSRSNSVVSICDFNQMYKELYFTVTACCTCENFLIVGLKGHDGRGCIAVYNPRISKVLKAIDVPYPVSSVEVVSCRGGATASTRCLCKNLRWMFGIVAVGTDEGHLYLVDLGFDGSHGLKNIPSQIEIVPPSLRNVPKTRENVAADNAFLAFELQASCHEEGVFHYALPDDEILVSYYPSDATVTVLLYEPRVASLFVGFSFGQFQIFSLQENMKLVYSSDFEGNSASLLKFAFQEPENDPRKFCYLWVARGMEEDLSSQKSPEPLTLSMFQLGYAKKEIITKPNQESEQRAKDSVARVVYKNFEVCNQRFEHSLGPGFITNISECYGSRLLMCSSIEKFSMEPVATENLDEGDFSLSPSTSFCVFGWQSTNARRHRDRNELNVIVFDINRWYMAQMPHCFHGNEDDFLFTGFWSFENERQILADDEEILGMHVPPEKIQHFVSGMRPLPERFFLPSACSFPLHLITDQSLNHYSLFGHQQKVLNSASELKSKCLVNPKRIHDDILASELHSQPTRNQGFTPDMMRENILTTALEHGQVSFLLAIIRDLASGHLAACGLTLRFVMDWAWKSVANVKNAVDELCVPIFDCTSPILDALVRSRLQFNSAQIHHLCIVFQKLLEYTEDASDQSKEELKTKLNVVALISQYLKVVQWFIGNGLLPEQLDNIEDNEEIMTQSGILIYKYTRLRQVYDQRRSELKRLEVPDLLLIDGWVHEIGDPLTSRWLKEEGGKTNYPPPSFMTVLDMYYLDCVDVITKHCLVMYLLYDVLAMFSTLDGEDGNPNADLHESQRERLNNIAAFMESFSVPTGIIKLTEGFWLLDHKNFEAALNVFLDPDTSRPYSTWQERRILRAFLYQGHPTMALKFISARHPKVETLDDAKMHITIFVKTREALKAWKLVQTSSGQHDNKELFTHLFTLCQKHSQLDQLLKLPFSLREEAMVIDYLKDSNSLEATQILVLFYLQQSKYVEAIKLHSQTKHIRLMRDQSEESRRRNAKLDHIVQSYSNLLPKIERELSFSGHKFIKQKPITKREMYKPSSVAAILHPSAHIEALSHAGQLVSLIDKMDQKRRAPQETVATPLRRRRFGPAVDNKIPEVNTFVFPTVDTSKRRNSFEPQGIFGNRSRFGSPARPSVSHDSRTTFEKSDASKSMLGPKERRLSSLSVASMLLQTPPIVRQRPSIGKHDAVQSIQTPQSILKVKKLGKDRGTDSSLISGISHTSSRLKVHIDEDVNETIESQSVFSEASGEIKREIPTISTPSAKLFNQGMRKKFKLETIRDGGEEQKPLLVDTPKILRFSGIDSSANDSGLSPALSPPIEQVAGLPNLTPIHVQAEDSISGGEMEVDVTGDEIEDQEEDKSIQGEAGRIAEQTEIPDEKSAIPGNEDQSLERIEISDEEEEPENREPTVVLQEGDEVEEGLEEYDKDEHPITLQVEEERDEEGYDESDKENHPVTLQVEEKGNEERYDEYKDGEHPVVQFSEPAVEENRSEGSDEVICLDSSSDEETNAHEEPVDRLQEVQTLEEKLYVPEGQGNESLRLVLTSSEESFAEDENEDLQEEDGYGTEEFTVDQEDSQQPVTYVNEDLLPSSSIHLETHKELIADKSSQHLDENIRKEDSEGAIATMDVFLSQTSTQDQEYVKDVIEQEHPAESEEQSQEVGQKLFPEPLVPPLAVDPQEEIEIQISDDEGDIEHIQLRKVEEVKVEERQEEEEEALKLHHSSSEPELSDENLAVVETREADSSSDLPPSHKMESHLFNPDEVTSDYQSMSATKMEEVMASPDQDMSRDISQTAIKQLDADFLHLENILEKDKSDYEGTSTSKQEVAMAYPDQEADRDIQEPAIKNLDADSDHVGDIVEEAKVDKIPTMTRATEGEANIACDKTPEKVSASDKNFPKIEIAINPATPVLDRIQTEPTFVLSPPTTRKSRRTRESKATQYTPKPPVSPAEEKEKPKKVPKSPSRVTRSTSKQSQDTPVQEPTFLFSPPQTRKRPGKKKEEQPVIKVKEPMATLSPPQSTTKRTRSKAKSSATESDQSPGHSPVRRSQRKSRSRSESKEASSPEVKPAPITPSRKTRQSPARKAPGTPTRSSRRLKPQSKLNMTSEPEPEIEIPPDQELTPVVVEEPSVSRRTRRRKTSVSSDVTSSGTESETPVTPSRRSTRKSAAKTKPSPKEVVKFPKLTPVAEEEEEDLTGNKKRKKEASGSKTTRVTRSTASYPTRMRRKAKVFKLDE